MNKLIVVAAGLLFAGAAAAGTSENCSMGMVDKQSCRAGVMMQCVRSFDPKSNEFDYAWYPVNATGQVFDASPSLFGKIAGYTPMPCTGRRGAKTENK